MGTRSSFLIAPTRPSGLSSVLVSVKGPSEAKARQERFDRAAVEVVFRPASGAIDDKEREYAHLIKGACESIILAKMHPRTHILIVVQVITDDGGIVGCAINGACLALLDAGIPTASMMGGVTLALLPPADDRQAGRRLLIDPTLAEAAEACCEVFLAFKDDMTLISSMTRGGFTDEEWRVVWDAGAASVQVVWGSIRNAIERRTRDAIALADMARGVK